MIKKSAIASAIATLDELSDGFKDDGQFEEAESIGEITTLIAHFVSLVGDNIVNDEEEVRVKQTGDMETLQKLALNMRELNARKLLLKGQMADVNIPLDELRRQRIPELMESLQLRTATFVGLGRVQLASDLFASTRKGMKPYAMQWLQDCGYGDMIKPSYSSSSLKALFRRMIIDGAEIPDNIFNVTPFTRASIVKV